MARKSISVTISDRNRDYGKVFTVTEMPAFQAEKWALRALLALGRSGADIPENIAAAGWMGIVALGVRAFLALSFADAEPLLDEAFDSCVSHTPDPTKPMVMVGAGGVGKITGSHIEEILTLRRLRDEVLQLHTGFSIAGILSMLMVPAVAEEVAESSPTMPISPEA